MSWTAKQLREARDILLDMDWPASTVDKLAPVVLDLSRQHGGDLKATAAAVVVLAHRWVKEGKL